MKVCIFWPPSAILPLSSRSYVLNYLACLLHCKLTTGLLTSLWKHLPASAEAQLSWDHSFLVSPNALQHGTQRCHPLSLSSLAFSVLPSHRGLFLLVFHGVRFCYPLHRLCAVVWIFPLVHWGLRSLSCCNSVSTAIQPSWLRVSCGVSQSWLPRPPTFPNAATTVISWVTWSNISNSLLNFLICRMNIIVTILKTKITCEVLWYSVWPMYSVK